ncbi:MAG: glycosyl hydrolase family 18 protein [Polyangiales bacterium]
MWTTSCDLGSRESLDAIALTKRLPGRGSVGVACTAVTAEGGLADEPGRPKLAARLAALGLQPSLLVANPGPGGFDGPLGAKVVTDPELRTKLARAIVQARAREGFGAIELDLESLPTSARDGYTALVKEVVATAGVPVAVDVHPKTVDDPGWDGPGAHDYKGIVDAGASLILMTYDLSIGPVPPGPSTKATWVREVVAYARALGIAPSKLMVGLPAYGYDFAPEGKGAAPLRHEEIVALRSKTKSALVRDPLGSPHFAYAGEGGTHEVWFDDAESIGRLLADLAPIAGEVRGIAIWGAGRADPALAHALDGAGL